MRQALIKLLGGYTEDEMRAERATTALQKLYGYTQTHSYMLLEAELANIREFVKQLQK